MDIIQIFPCLPLLHNESYLVYLPKAKPYNAWGDPIDIPLGFNESLMEWGTSLAWKDGEWSRRSFMLDKTAWDHGIESSLRIRAMQRTGKIQWRIWDLGTFCSDNEERQVEKQCLRTSNFWQGGL